MVFLYKLLWLGRIFCTFLRQSNYPALRGPYRVPFWLSILALAIFFVSFCSPWGCVDQCIIESPIPLVRLQYPFCFSGNNSQIIKLEVNVLPNSVHPIIIILLATICTLTLPGGISLESEWQHVYFSPGFLLSILSYFNNAAVRGVLDPSSNFQLLTFLFPIL